MHKLKTIFSILALCALALSAEASDQLLNSLKPKNGQAVNDFAGVISGNEEFQIEKIIDELEQKTGAEIAVVTIKSLDGGEIDDFTNRLFEKWGVGQKGKDNGLMFLAAMKDRKMRIEVGYGLEGAIPDSKAGRIRRDVITPYFKANQPGKGILAGVAVLSQEIAKEYNVQLTGDVTNYAYNQTRQRSSQRRGNPILGIIITIAFIAFAIRHPHLAMLLLLSGGGGGRSGGGFGGGGGFSGGGFGGGMSGGGGSSGGW